MYILIIKEVLLCSAQNVVRKIQLKLIIVGGCGANISQIGVNSIAATSAEVSNKEMTFGRSIATCFAKYADFKGRASRSEFWWFYLFTILLSWGSTLVDSTQILSIIINLAVFLPVVAAGCRRLHDTNRSGWWQLIMLTIIGLISLIIWWASEGSDQRNEYGEPV